MKTKRLPVQNFEKLSVEPKDVSCRKDAERFLWWVARKKSLDGQQIITARETSRACFGPQEPMSVEEALDQRRFLYRLERSWPTLTPKEEKILKMHYGIDEDRKYTIREIAEDFELKIERVKEIIAHGLRKLRHPMRMGVFIS